MSFLLAHLSDPHLGPLPPPRVADLMNKRLTGYINWLRRRTIHNMDVLARVVADMRAQKPDHVMMTGDALNIGLAGEFVGAATWLETLGAPRDVSFIPGNHDLYVRANSSQIASTFGAWTRGGDGVENIYPYVRQRGGLALIGLSSAIVTPPFIASGRLGADQLDRLSEILEETEKRGLMRVVMIHHPPWRGGATPGRGLRDSRGFERVIARRGAELIVHGHNHRTMTKRLPSPRGFAPVIGVRSASAVPGSTRHLAGYHLYRVTRRDAGWRIDAWARGLREGSESVVDLGPIAL